MWSSRSPFLVVRVRLRGMRPRIRLLLPMALFVLYQLLLACDGALALIPGEAGDCARAAMDTAQAVLLAVMGSPPQQYVHADIEDGSAKINVDIKTTGFFGGEEG